MFKNQKFQFVLIFLFILSGCSQKPIKIKKDLTRLPHLGGKQFSYDLNNIYINIKKLNSNDCWYALGVNCLSCGIQPIAIVIKNDSNDIIYFNPESTQLALIEPEDAARRCHWRTYEVTYHSSLLAALFYWPALVVIGSSGYAMKKRNEEITISITRHAIDSWDSIKILPSETFHKILFIDQTYTPDTFKLRLFNKDKKETQTIPVEL